MAQSDRLGGFVTITWIANKAGVSRQRIHKLIGEGKLAGTFANGHWWIRDDVARDWIARRAHLLAQGPLDLDDKGGWAA